MAFLMLLHEKMRLQRRHNKLTLKQLRMGNKIDRIKRNIENKQKYYQKLEQNLDNMAKRFQNNANLAISNMFGVGTNMGWNPYNIGGGSILTRSAMEKFAADKECGKYAQAYLQNQSLFSPVKDSNGNTTGEYKYNNETISADKFKKIYELASQAGQCAQQDRMMAQQFQSDYQNNISIWLDAQKEALNAEQDMVLDALQDQENDYEMEKTGIETELEYIKQRKEAIESALAEGIKDSAPKFGLG